MTKKKQTDSKTALEKRVVKSPAKEGSIPKDVAKAAVQAVSKQPKVTIKSLQEELKIVESQRDVYRASYELINGKVEATVRDMKTTEASRDYWNKQYNDLKNKSLFSIIVERISKLF